MLCDVQKRILAAVISISILLILNNNYTQLGDHDLYITLVEKHIWCVYRTIRLYNSRIYSDGMTEQNISPVLYENFELVIYF